MLYQKIKVACKDCPKRFYRVMYVRKNLNLQQLGFTILCSLRCEFEHAFLFKDAKSQYLPAEWLEVGFREADKNMEQYTVADLQLKAGNKFTLEYDTGDGWEFTITVYDDEKEIDDEFFGTNIEAKGDRIWEDARCEFLDFLGGKKVDLPWNAPEDAEPENFDDNVDMDDLNDDTEVYEEYYEEFFEEE